MEPQVLHGILESVVTIVLALAGWGVTKYIKKLGIQIDAQQFFQKREVAQAIVLLIEEQFAAKKKAGALVPSDPNQPTKSQAAVSELVQHFPALSNTEARNLVDEAVIRLGLGAALGGVKPPEPR